jgi:lipase chaperone LimK
MMMSALYRLAYLSKNTVKGNREEIEAEIRSILASSHRNNPALGITGALLYSGGYFCQVLEGPQDALEDLFETIQMDERHGQVTVLQFEPIEARSFGEWAMAFAGIEDEMRFDGAKILDSKDEIQAAETGRNLVSTLDRLVRQHQGVLKPS